MLPDPPGDTITWGSYPISTGMSYSFAFTTTVKRGTAFLGDEVTNTACFTSTNAGSGCDDAVFTIQEAKLVYLPLVMRGLTGTVQYP